jgi:transposase-like protein
MSRSDAQLFARNDPTIFATSTVQMHSPELSCSRCEYTLECVEQNRRSGTWLGSFICPNCRSEYFYAYRWGRLMQKS